MIVTGGEAGEAFVADGHLRLVVHEVDDPVTVGRERSVVALARTPREREVHRQGDVRRTGPFRGGHGAGEDARRAVARRRGRRRRRRQADHEPSGHKGGDDAIASTATRGSLAVAPAPAQR